MSEHRHHHEKQQEEEGADTGQDGGNCTSGSSTNAPGDQVGDQGIQGSGKSPEQESVARDAPTAAAVNDTDEQAEADTEADNDIG